MKKAKMIILSIIVLAICTIIFSQTLSKALNSEENQTNNMVDFGESTQKLYKGYMYYNSLNETIFNEVQEFDIKKMENQIKISNQSQIFIDNEGNEYDATNSIIYKSIQVNKNNLIKIFGQDYELNILDEEDNVITRITDVTESDEQGNISVDYEEEISNIKIITTYPKSEGKLLIKNTRAIRGESDYSLQELKSFNKLVLNYDVIKDDVSTANLEISLEDTKTEAKIEMNNTNLSTLQPNEDVSILITLKSDTNEYDLYKNPTIEISIPIELDINLREIKQLNFEEELQIAEAKTKNTDDGRRIIRLELEGEQINYADATAGGIQILMTGDINISNTVPSKEETIQLLYTNANRSEETFTNELPVNINSKEGVLLINKLENYSNSEEIIETTDDRTVEMEIEADTERSVAKQTINIINNYEKPISNVVIISEMENSGETVELFKLELDKEIMPQELFTREYELDIPVNLRNGEELYIKTELQYDYQESPQNITSDIKLYAENKKAESTLMQLTEEFEEIGVSVETKARNTDLKDGDSVYEGETVKYNIKVTNNTNQPMSDIVLEATNTNAIYYNYIQYEASAFGDIMTQVKYDEDEKLNSKELKIEKLDAGETKELSYQVSIKEVEGNDKTLTGKIDISVSGELKRTVETITNPIIQGKLKLNIKNLVSDAVELHGLEPMQIGLYAKNIGDSELTNVILEVPISNYLELNEEAIGMTGDVKGEFIEYKNGIVKIKIAKIEPKQTAGVFIQPKVKSIPIKDSEVEISQYFIAKNGNETYYSNDLNKKAKQYETEITAEQTTNIQGNVVKDGENIQFIFQFENRGLIEKNVTMNDIFELGLNLNRATIINNGKEENIELSGTNILDTTFTIKPNERIIITADTTLDAKEVTGNKIKNVATFSRNNS